MHIGGGQWRTVPVTQPLRHVWDAPPRCKLPPTLWTRSNAPPRDTPPDFLAEVIFPILGSHCAVNSVDFLRPDWWLFPQLGC